MKSCMERRDKAIISVAKEGENEVKLGKINLGRIFKRRTWICAVIGFMSATK